MSENSFEEITVQKVFDLIANYMKDAHDVLFNVLNEDPHYKRLIKMGEKQYFDAPNESSFDIEPMKSRLCLAETNHLACAVDDELNKIVQEKFQGDNLIRLKDEVLRAILLLSSGEVNHSHVTPQTPIPISCIKIERDVEKQALSQTNNLSNNIVKNSKDIKKQTSNVTNGQAKLHLQKDMDIDNWDPDISVISFDSVSSVHTSDLSSFEDEISLSSEEELGEKRKLSLREVQQKLEKSKSEILDEDDDVEDYDQNKNKAVEDAHSDSHINNNESSSMTQKSQRRRKPNVKYGVDDVTLPFKKKFIGKISNASQSTGNDTRRKRGRPRKHLT